MRLISICPSNTELVAYLGLENDLVAVDDYSDWPESVLKLPKLGPDLSINIDKLIALMPDLVLASLSVPGMEKNIFELEKHQVPYVIFNPQSLADIADDLLTLGTLTKTETRAKHVQDIYKTILEDYRQQSHLIKKVPSLYWEWWPKPVFTPGKLNWLTEISACAGGVNLFATEQVASVQTNWDDVLARKPDHICVAWVGVKQENVNLKVIKSRPGWDKLAAVQQDNIHVLEEPLFCRPSPRLLVGLKKLAPLLHPDLFPADDGLDPLLLT